MKTSSIDILLATCEGERFIKEQLDSLLAQTYSNFRILVRDDASHDKTPEILASFKERFPEKMTVFFNKKREGVKSNFSRLMELSTAPYIMFSDQDDVWMSDKIEKTLVHMKGMEQQHGNHPFLVHTDLAVVDEQLKMLHSSFWKYSRLKPVENESLNRLLSQNVVTGCTMMVNRLLLEIARPIHPDTFMHDWWIALTASAFGKIGLIQEPTLYYRQHGGNALGARKFASLLSLKNNFRKLMEQDVRKFHQAAAFYHRYHDLFSLDHRTLMQAFIDLQRKSWTKKRVEIYKYGFFKQGLLRNAAEFVLG